MAVEIVILSGARQGQRVLLDAREFRAGDDPGCEVFFDPATDAAVTARCALFRLTDDGWIVRSAGQAEIFLNQEPVVGKARVRSGDLVRMSERGPDFSFGIVTAAAAASPVSAPAPVSAAAPPALPPSPVEAPPPAEKPELATPIASEPRPETPTSTTPLTSTQPAESPPVREAAAEPWRHAFWALVGLAACMLVVVVVLSVVFVRFAGRGSTEVAGAAAPPPPPSQPEAPAARPEVSPETSPAAPEIPAKAATEPVDVWQKAAESLRGAVFLIQVEVGGAGSDSMERGDSGVRSDPIHRVDSRINAATTNGGVNAASTTSGHFLPFATCCAIGENTLLVSAREAAILARWRQQDGYQLWVANQANQIKQEIRDIRVDRAFAELASKPNDWIFANIGLLTVDGKLPTVARLPSPDHWPELEEGAPLASFGYGFEEVDKITRFDTFEPELAKGRILLATPREKPSLVHLQAKIASNAYGSPIVNAQGEIVGVYSEVLPPESTPLKDLHLVTVVDSAAIHAWLDQGDTKRWVPPPVQDSQPSP